MQLSRSVRILPWLALGIAGSVLPAAAQTPPPDSTPMPLHLASASLKPGDVLRLRIWREPDWSGDYQVDEHGMAVLPRLGATVVAEVPADQLRRQLVEQYRQFLNNPSVEIIPLRRVAVVGAVRNPGVYTIDPSVTLGQVANVAGGPTPEAKRNQIELQRAGNRQRVDLNDHPELAGLMLESGDRVYLPERSWLSRNATWFVSTLVGAAGTTAYLLTR